VHIFTVYAHKRLFRSFRSKTWPRHSLQQPQFPIRQMYFHYRVTFTGYIRCFSATTSHDLVTLTFDHLTLRVFHVQCFSCPTHIPIFIRLSYDYRLLSYELLNLITFPLTGTVIAHVPCHMNYHPGQKYVHIFEIPDPNLPIHFVTFGCYDED